MSWTHRKSRLLAVSTLVAIGASGTAFAQTAEPAPQDGTATATAQAPEANNGSQLEEIVVTARKREENLQTAPVAVTALTTESLKELRATNLDTLNAIVPNLTVTPAVAGASGASFYIRGIGQNDPSPYLDSPNAIYINGVLRARATAALGELGDLERIEVLRGPQGTLFGRNTTGGAISIFTPAPTADANASVVLGVGTEGERVARATVNTGELGNSGLRLKVNAYHHNIDGVVRNILSDPAHSPGAYNNNGVDVRLAGDYGVFKFDYEYDYARNKAQAYSDQIVAVVNPTFLSYFSASQSLGGDPFVVNPQRQHSVAIDPAPTQDVQVGGHALTINLDFSNAFSVKSITAYRYDHEYRPSNIASQGRLLGRIQDTTVPAGHTIQEVTPLRNTYRTLDEHQFSQELQLLGTLGDFNYVAGAYYFTERFHEVNQLFITTVLSSTLGRQGVTRYQTYYGTDSLAGFAQGSWRPGGGKLELTGGLRYTWDKKLTHDQLFFNGAQTRNFTGDKAFRNLSGAVSASYRFNPDVMLYLRGSTGYKAGGFVPGTAIGPFLPEKAKSIEGGIKSELFDRHVRLNLAAFYTQYRDLQVTASIVNPVTQARFSTLTNAGKANYWGIEGEFNAILGGGFSADGNFGYVNPRYDQYPYFNGTTTVNVGASAKFPLVSKVTFDAGLRYTSPLTSIGTFTVRADYAYQSAQYFSPLIQLTPNQELLRADPQGFFNVRGSLSDIPLGGDVFKSVRLDVYVDNVFDKDPYLFGIDSVNYYSKMWGRGRQGGVSLTFGF